MDLTNKNKVDFKDAHLWAADAKFFCSIPVAKLSFIMPCLAGMRLTIHPFLDFDPAADLAKWGVTVEAVPIVDVAPFTCDEINKFLKIAHAIGSRPTIEHDGHVALLATDGTILERWEADRR